MAVISTLIVMPTRQIEQAEPLVAVERESEEEETARLTLLRKKLELEVIQSLDSTGDDVEL